MKICFWNIGQNLTAGKISQIDQLLNEISPDLFCIAEGPRSEADSATLIASVTNRAYRCYYGPHFHTNSTLGLDYGWNEFGLKVFIKNGSIGIPPFAYENQKLDGRIVHLKQKDVHLFFVHGFSKSGDELKQHDFVSELAGFIRMKLMGNNSDQIVIIGDFNIEPWEGLLRKRKYIDSHFFKKAFEFHLDRAIDNRYYWNPILEYLQTNTNGDLIGSFYNKNFVSLLDFALCSKNITNPKIEIITRINGTDLIFRKRISSGVIEDFDHLPIMLDIK
ncbi:MAG: endonuclease/exonuclease/phosphatase family protein [Cyclobacteriaceae bacterium]|nr:endonuclease/exonuclease/phosphatase family protein [Cyclobacteriaceae bacterium]